RLGSGGPRFSSEQPSARACKGRRRRWTRYGRPSGNGRRAVAVTARPRSVHRSAGDVDDLSRHETRFGADQVGSGMGDVLRPADAAHGDGLRRPALELFEVQAEPPRRGPGHVTHDEARCDGVGGDAVLAELEGERLGEADQPRLGAGVVDPPGVSHGGDAGHGDDAPQPASIMYGATARANRNAPRRLTPKTLSHCSVVISTSSTLGPIPALLTSTVGGPSSAATRATASPTMPSSATSAATARAVPPSPLIASTVAAQSASARSMTATAMPSHARQPHPRPPPTRRPCR